MLRKYVNEGEQTTAVNYGYESITVSILINIWNFNANEAQEISLRKKNKQFTI
jgi:hypothetical protein